MILINSFSLTVHLEKTFLKMMSILTLEMIKKLSYPQLMNCIEMIIDNINIHLNIIEMRLNKRLMENSFHKLETI
jgi:hypothetical protein